MNTIAPLDLLIIAAYFAALIAMGWLARRKPATDDNYLLLGRRLTLPAFLLSLVASWYGGILGSSEYGYRFGLSNWFVFGMPYYVFAAIFAIFLARSARERFVTSIPDLLATHFGESCRLPASLLVLVLSSPAPYVLSMGVLLHFLTGTPLLVGIVASALFSFAYVFRDGLAVIIRTDLFQSALMFIGYGTLIAFAVLKWGGPTALADAVAQRSPSHLSLTGGEPLSTLMVWFFIGSWTLVAPMFHQRVYALRNARLARPGIFISIAFWALFDLLTTLAALYAFGFLPQLDDPRLSHLALAQAILPVGLYGLFITAILAVIMSTLDTELFVSGSTLGPDILGRTRRFTAWPAQRLTQLAMAIVLVASVLLALLLPSVVELFFTIGTIAVPGLLLPVLSACKLLPSIPTHRARFHLFAVPTTAATWFLLGSLTQSPPFTTLQPFYPGFALSILLWLLPRKPHNASQLN